MVEVQQCEHCNHMQIIWQDNDFCRNCGRRGWKPAEPCALRDTLEDCINIIRQPPTHHLSITYEL